MLFAVGLRFNTSVEKFIWKRRQSASKRWLSIARLLARTLIRRVLLLFLLGVRLCVRHGSSHLASGASACAIVPLCASVISGVCVESVPR